MAHTRLRGTLFGTVLLLVLGAAPLALAQTTPKPKKKGAKPAATAPATDAAADTAPPPAAPSAEPAKPVEPPTPPAASESETAKPDTTPAEAGSVSASGAYDPNDMTYTREDPTKSYTFVGVRYRGTIIPAFLEHLFVNDGGTVYSNSIGAEVDFRRDGKSNILWLAYTEYGFGNTLFLQKGVDDVPQNYSIVSSSLKGIYIGLDEQWSAPVADHLDFEYGFGLGLGGLFGSIYNSWVYQTGANTPGAIGADNGNYYAPCASTSQTRASVSMNSCNPSAHQNSTEVKVGNYSEKNWFQGGSVPVIFPHIAGNIGLRYKPIKQLQTRVDLGISLTGFWFGLSADYGLEKTNDSGTTKPSVPPAKEHTPGSGDEPKTSAASTPRWTL